VQIVGDSVAKPETNQKWAVRHDVKMPMINDTDY
jgi:peroxiredoxin